MEQRALGRSGVVVSRLTPGAVTRGGDIDRDTGGDGTAVASGRTRHPGVGDLTDRPAGRAPTVGKEPPSLDAEDVRATPALRPAPDDVSLPPAGYPQHRPDRRDGRS